MAKWKVVLTDREFESIEIEKTIMKSVDAELFTYNVKEEKELIEIVSDCDAVIMQYANLSRPVIESMEKCKIISKYAIGVDRIDIAAATERGICVANVPGYCVDEVSTHTMALILNLSRKVTKLNNAVKAGNWDYKIAKKIYNLRGMTLGINSFGQIGRSLAEKMSPFGMRIIAHDPFVKPEIAKQLGVELVDFPTLCAQSDVLSTHVADFEETRGLFNKDVFKAMKNTAIFINMGRGPVVNESDLAWALQNGEIAAAGLDVTHPEPIESGNPLLAMDNVIITPHSAYYSEDSQQRLQQFTAESVAQRLQGLYPKNLVNRELIGKLDLKMWET